MLVRVGGNGTAPGSSLWLWCPGCNHTHRITINSATAWTWDGNTTAPTISPSILVHSHKTLTADHSITDTPRCHSFIRNGYWEFLGDSTHALAGQTVPMVELPEWLDDTYVGEV